MLLGLTAVYVAVRLLNLDALVTTDEPLWLGRSANFYRALRAGDFEYTYQMAHPGVLTMWAGAMAFLVHAPEYATRITSNLDVDRNIDITLRQIGIDPLSMMVAAKVSKVLLQGVFFAIAMVFCIRLLNRWVALAAGLLIAFDPFLSGLDSALHVDGLFAIASFAAVLSICHAADQTDLSRGTISAALPWAVAGFLCACAWLTRATGVVLVGVVCLSLFLLLTDNWRKLDGRFDLGLHSLSMTKIGLVWLGTATMTTFALFPALWVTPVDVGLRLIGWNLRAAVTGHENPTFFQGEIYPGDPGLTFYPVSILWRTTPVAWLGILALIVLVIWGWRSQFLSQGTVRLFISLGVFAGVYLLLMSLGSKKFDRYALPVYPVLSLFAATGFWLMCCCIADRLPKARQAASTLLLALGVAVQGAMLIISAPYRLDYYSPVLGGNSEAREVLQLGWGQGGREVVDYVLEHSTPNQTSLVRTSSQPSVFRYFLTDDSSVQIQDTGIETPADWFETDWYVAGIQHTQRELDHSYRMLAQYDPVHIVSVEGVPYFWIYTPSTLPLPEELGGISP